MCLREDKVVVTGCLDGVGVGFGQVKLLSNSSKESCGWYGLAFVKLS